MACLIALATPVFSTAQETTDPTLRELITAVAAERQRIAELEAEIAQRSAVLAGISARLDALAGAATPTPAAVTEAVPPSSPAAPPAPAPTPAPARFELNADSLFRVATLQHGYDGCVGCPSRTVGRMRVRLGVQGQMAPGVRAAIGLASGELNDPNTVYQTFGGNLGRKAVSWDRAYVAFRPPSATWMELTAGKFPYPWVRSSMTFDVDFYPEGAAERFAFDFAPTATLRNVALQGFQIVANEQANGPDTMLIGAQATTGWQFSDRLSTRVIGTGINITNPEHVLRSQLDGSNIGVRNTNATRTDGGRPVYASSFRYANLIIENSFRTAWPALPITVALEYQRNLRAATARDRAVSLRVDGGRALRRGDWQFGWHVFQVEQEAILSALGESDWRAPSNVLQHRIAGGVMLHGHVQALVTWYRGRTLDRDAPGALLLPNLRPGAREPWANRVYFDLLYRY